MALPALQTRWLTRPRLVGTPLRWASGSGQFGLMLGVLGALAFTAPALGLHNFLLLAGLALAPGLVGLVLGTGLGLFVPGILALVRGRVPLPLVTAGAIGLGGLVGALAGYAWWIALALAMQPEVYLGTGAAIVGGVIGSVGVALWWLPFTVATVLGRSWPVSTAVGVGLPAAVFLALLLVF